MNCLLVAMMIFAGLIAIGFLIMAINLMSIATSF